MLLVGGGGSRKDNKKRCPKLLGNSQMVMSFLVWLGIIASKRTFLRHFTTALLKYVKSTWCEGSKDLQLLVKLGPSLSHYQAGIWTLESPFSLAGLATLFLVICLPHRGLFISVTVTPDPIGTGPGTVQCSLPSEAHGEVCFINSADRFGWNLAVH